MKSFTEFCAAVHAKFPALAAQADRKHEQDWGEPAVEELEFYCWFGSMANALNDRMRSGEPVAQAAEFFEFVSRTWTGAESNVKGCIDVSLVENLFWEVSPQEAAPYWAALPSPLQELYLGFHRHAPS